MSQVTCEWCGKVECLCDQAQEREKRDARLRKLLAPTGAFYVGLAICGACGLPLVIHGKGCGT